MPILKVAFISGDHPFDVISMYDLLADFDGMKVYPQHILDFCTDTGGGNGTLSRGSHGIGGSYGAGRQVYDALVFYNMTMDTPTADNEEGAQKALRETIESFGSIRQGLVILHHALLAFPEWRKWSDIVGIENRKFGFYPDQVVPFNVESADHPIMKGVDNFTMTDETYTLDEPDNDSALLLSTTHKQSIKSIAWCREHQKSRVFCYQSGHDNTSFSNSSFQTILRNGILWAAGAV
jgi:uncharacterized protein